MKSASTQACRIIAKHILDVLGSLILLALLSPIMLVAAILIRCNTRGPVLFHQQRLGINGRSFGLWKFRTMLEGSGAASHDRLAENDPRITSSGRGLRSWGIDELPQLWNVLKGQMSLVGPRPAPLYHLNQYTLLQRKRLLVRPGLTGWAFIHGRNNIPWKERIELDVWYVENWSLLLDMKVLFKSLFVILKREGVYGPSGTNDTFV